MHKCVNRHANRVQFFTHRLPQIPPLLLTPWAPLLTYLVLDHTAALPNQPPTDTNPTPQPQTSSCLTTCPRSASL